MLRKLVLALSLVFLAGCAHVDPYKKLDKLYEKTWNQNQKLDKFLDEHFPPRVGKVVYEDGTPVKGAYVEVFINNKWREFGKEMDVTNEWGIFMVRFQNDKKPIVAATIFGRDSLDLSVIENSTYAEVPDKGQILLKMYRNGQASIRGKVKNIYPASKYSGVSADMAYKDFHNLVLRSSDLGDDGDFNFKNLQPGRYFIRVFSACYMFSAEIDLRPGLNTINPELVADKACVEQMNKESKTFRK